VENISGNKKLKRIREIESAKTITIQNEEKEQKNEEERHYINCNVRKVPKSNLKGTKIKLNCEFCQGPYFW
jgi:hypothetical protein